MALPVVLAVDENGDSLARVEEHLARRYGGDYSVRSERSVAAALSALESMRAERVPVALVLADQGLEGLTGAELLDRVKALHPTAKRGLLIPWGGWSDPRVAAAIFEAMSLGRIDYYVLKPGKSPDELFHRTIAEFLFEWARSDASVEGEIELVGEAASPRMHRLRDLLGRNGIPYAAHSPESEPGRRLLADAEREDSRLPVARVRDGQTLIDPSDRDLATAFGVSTELSGDREFDVAIVGAGPAGLAAGVYASSEGMRALIIEREAIGGQAGSSSLIRNYLGFARGISGAELAQRAYQQAWVFGTSFLMMREVEAIVPDAAVHRLRIGDDEVLARAIVLASGVSYRRLETPTLARFEGSGVFYGASAAEAKALAGKCAFVVGGGNSAGQAAMHLGRFAARVTIVVRGASLADSMSSYLRREIEAADNIEVRLESEVVDGAGDGRLESLTLRDRNSHMHSTVPADALFVMIGARPGTGWLPPEIERDRWGYICCGPDVSGEAIGPAPRPMLETSLDRVFAVGDVRHGATKRVASAVGEGSIVIQQVLQRLETDAPAIAAVEPC